LPKKIILFLLTIFNLAIFTQVANDDFSNATDINSLHESCSSYATYRTIVARADSNVESSSNNSEPQQNVWFAFVSASTGEVKIDIQIDGSKGAQSRTQFALWESNGTTEVEFSRYVSNGNDVSVSSTGLTIRNYYYL
jgi:hypothetical protein